MTATGPTGSTDAASSRVLVDVTELQALVDAITPLTVLDVR